MASMASRAASSEPSGTSTFWGASSVSLGWCSTAVSRRASMPAASRIAWISSASAMSSATATCTIRVITLRTLRDGLRLRDGLGLPMERSSLAELRCAPLLERDVDNVEVPGNDRLGEDGACLPRDLAGEIARREMGEREHAHVGGASDGGGVERRRVGRLARPLLLLVAERRLVDEHVGATSGLQHARRRRRVPREHDLAPGALGPEHHLRRYCPAVREHDRAPGLEGSTLRPFRDCEP